MQFIAIGSELRIMSQRQEIVRAVNPEVGEKIVARY